MMSHKSSVNLNLILASYQPCCLNLVINSCLVILEQVNISVNTCRPILVVMGLMESKIRTICYTNPGFHEDNAETINANQRPSYF